jgi:hypothetical protein
MTSAYLSRCADAASHERFGALTEWEMSTLDELGQFMEIQIDIAAEAFRRDLHHATALAHRGRTASALHALTHYADTYDNAADLGQFYAGMIDEGDHADLIIEAVAAGPEAVAELLEKCGHNLPAPIRAALAALLTASADRYQELAAELVRSLLEGEHSTEHAHGRQAQHRERCPHRRRIMATANTADPDAHTLSKYGAMSSRNSNREANRRR